MHRNSSLVAKALLLAASAPPAGLAQEGHSRGIWGAGGDNFNPASQIRTQPSSIAQAQAGHAAKARSALAKQRRR